MVQFSAACCVFEDPALVILELRGHAHSTTANTLSPLTSDVESPNWSTCTDLSHHRIVIRLGVILVDHSELFDCVPEPQHNNKLVLDLTCTCTEAE